MDETDCKDKMNANEEDKKSSVKRNVTEIEEGSLEKKEMDKNCQKKLKIDESDSESNEKNSGKKYFDYDDKKSSEVMKIHSNYESLPEESIKKDLDSGDKNPSKKNSNEESLSAEDKRSEDKRSIEEGHFNNLFMNALDIFQKKNPIEELVILGAIKKIKDSFLEKDFNMIDFNITKYLHAYFEHYSTLNAAVSRHRFLNAIINVKELKTCLNMSKLNVISLGGGPGTDMVGFCSALQECREKPIPILNFCVVDKYKRWKSFFDIIKVLLRKKDYGNTSKLFQDQRSNICLSFMEVDIMDKSPPRIYQSEVYKADVVLLVRVLDSIKFRETKDVLNDIAQKMKKDALLVLVDCFRYNYNKKLLKEIYFSELEEFQLKELDYIHAKISKANYAVYSKI